MKRILYSILPILLLISSYSFGQTCLSGVHTLSQSDIDNFSTNYPTCTEITGDITFNSNITSLNGLSQVTKWSGYLDLNDCDNLTDLNGLHNIDTIMFLWIRNCDNLSDLTGLGSLEHVSMVISFSNNANMAALTGINQLSTIDGSIYIDDCPRLKNLQGLESITHIEDIIKLELLDSLATTDNLNSLDSLGGININNCHLLQDLDGFSQIESTTEYLQIADCEALNDISGLSSIKTVSGALTLINIKLLKGLTELSNLESVLYLNILEMDSLENLNGLENLDSASYITIKDNPKLTSISGISNINSTTIYSSFPSFPALTISDNPLLVVCEEESICNYLDLCPTRTSDIQNNAPGCNTRAEVEAACTPSTTVNIHAIVCNNPTMPTAIRASDNNSVYDKYKFRFYDSDPSDPCALVIDSVVVATGITPSFFDSTSLAFDTDYWITADVEVAGVFQGEGPACSFQIMNPVKLRNGHCDEELGIVANYIWSNHLSVYDQYKYKYYDKDPSTNNDAILIDSIIVDTDENLRYKDTLHHLLLDTTQQ